MITIEGKAKVWAKEFDGKMAYSISVSNKDQEGKWHNAYQSIRFKKGERVENGTVIDFRAFPTIIIGKDKNRVIWQIFEFRTAQDDMASPDNIDGFARLTEDDIPF